MKQQFIKGAWYYSSKWISLKAAKFDEFNRDGYFSYSENLQNNKHEISKNTTYTDGKDWSSFREVFISEIAHLLPSNHPDLQQNVLNSLEIW